MTNWILPALIMGLAGSVHCAGMCGPIALVIAGKEGDKKISGIFLYNFGRIITYTLLGVISGLAGHSVLWFAGQQWLSIIAGCIILISLVAVYVKIKWLRIFSDRLLNRLRSVLGKAMKGRRTGTLLYMGVLNGMLPCGLVYAALGGAAATGSFAGGAMFMAVFGAATVPVLFAISFAGSKISPLVYRKLVKLIPYTMAIMGILLIVRGLGLGIPYLSPAMECGTMECCHHVK